MKYPAVLGSFSAAAIRLNFSDSSYAGRRIVDDEVKLTLPGEENPSHAAEGFEGSNHHLLKAYG